MWTISEGARESAVSQTPSSKEGLTSLNIRLTGEQAGHFVHRRRLGVTEHAVCEETEYNQGIIRL